MKIGPFTFTRESAIWWVGLVAAVVTGLATLDADTAVKTFGISAALLPKLRLASLIIGIGSAWAKTSPFPSKKDATSIDVSKLAPVIIIMLLGGAAMTFTGCGGNRAPAIAPAPVKSNAEKAAAILHRVDELQNAVISANQLTPGSIPDAIAVPLVKFCVEAAKVLKDAPNGVLPAIAAEWRSLKAQVPPEYRRLPAIAGAYLAVDVALAEFGQ